jgi:hypothetical protein
VLFLFSNESASRYVVHAGLEPVTVLPQPPLCWDYRHSPPHPGRAFADGNETTLKPTVLKDFPTFLRLEISPLPCCH